MNFPSESKLVTLCTAVAQDPLLVQGAGGNLSAKEGQELWIKASGTWLSEAAKRNIFIPLNRLEVEEMVANKAFEKLPSAVNGSELRPSIETWLHALMPQKYVLHLHALDVLALLVRVNSEKQLKELGTEASRWGFVSYVKPGPDLALAVSNLMLEKPSLEVLMLENHGIVMAANSIERIVELLSEIRTLAAQPARDIPKQVEPVSLKRHEYVPVRDLELHNLSNVPWLLELVTSAWAIAPDHVVFLGPKPAIFKSTEEFLDYLDLVDGDSRPLVAFIENVGVFSRGHLDVAGEQQLRAYFDLLVRQADGAKLRTFSASEIAELLNWDAEKYRQAMRK